METPIRVVEIAERYRRIARRTFNSKVADEIRQIAEDFERIEAPQGLCPQ